MNAHQRRIARRKSKRALVDISQAAMNYMDAMEQKAAEVLSKALYENPPQERSP